MSLHPQPITPVPPQTRQVAQAAFPHGNRYLQLRDTLGTLYDDALFADLFPARGQAAQAPWQLALVTLLQFAENLSDRQAADAVRSRIDWKYLLGLELTDPGFDFSILSEFRQRLVAGKAEERLLHHLLVCCQDHNWLKAGGKQRTDSTPVLARIRAMNRLECVAETMRFTLNSLASLLPDWLASHLQPEWAARYGPRAEEYRLPHTKPQRLAYAQQIGQDGWWLLDRIEADQQAAFLWQLPAIDILRRVWLQQFRVVDGQLLWRVENQDELPPSAQLISSPYDLEARFSRKRATMWVGYKVHLTETCEADQPHLITQVATTVSTEGDSDTLPQIQQALAATSLLPSQQLVDTAYVSAERLVQSQELYRVDLVGPARKDQKWQALAGKGFAAADFTVDWENHQATCPQGHTSRSWFHTTENGQPRVFIKFSRKQCGPCSVRPQCTRMNRRGIKLRADAPYQALQAARARDSQADWPLLYNQRAGIEGTLSQGVRGFGLRRSRYMGLAKTHAQHLFIATAMNLWRIVNWLNEVPLAQTRQAAFERLMPPAVGMG
jgi:transposase